MSAGWPLAGTAAELHGTTEHALYGALLLSQLGAAVAMTANTSTGADCLTLNSWPTTKSQPITQYWTPLLRSHFQTKLDEPSCQDWAMSGAMGLTGYSLGPALDPHTRVGTRMRGAATAAASLVSLLGGALVLDGPALLAERSAFTGFSRQGAISPGGSCRLLRASDRWLVVNLPRESDLELVPAWLQDGAIDAGNWIDIQGRLASMNSSTVLANASMLGLAVAALPLAPNSAAPDVEVPGGEFLDLLLPPLSLSDCLARTPPMRGPSSQQSAVRPFRITTSTTRANRGEPSLSRRPLVVDLTSLWAGPLCGQLLSSVGARVIKVESQARPDGARNGSSKFFDLLNGTKESIALDPRHEQGREQLRRLISQADIVLESFRPHVMTGWGLAPEDLLTANPHLSVISISAYGRSGPAARTPGYGDDIAVAGGFLTSNSNGDPLFCADAAADPMTGLHAFVAALACLVRGGGQWVEVVMRDVVRSMTSGDRHWSLRPGSAWKEPMAPPRAREGGIAPELGSDTDAVLREIDFQ